jgi:hypothetical protein
VPVAAVATALVVWVAVQRDADRSPASQTPATETAQSASAPAQPVAVAPRDAAPNTAPGTSALPTRRRADDVRAKDQERVVGGIAGGHIDAVQPRGQAGAGAVAGGQAITAAPLEPAPSPPSPSAPLPPLARASPPESPPPSSAQLKTGSQGLAETVTVTDTASGLPAAGERGGIGLRAREIASPDANYRWRILPAGSIERSTDGGRTWAIVDPPPIAGASALPTILTAGASPARDVCWIVGLNGIVLLTTDGATWRRHPIPETVDLTGVRATDATHAVVTTASGRQFATTDGGLTWTATK